MSKQKKGALTREPLLSWGHAYVVADNIQDRVFGRVFTIIEALGLSDKQEESLKGLVRGAVWNVFEDSIFISPETHSKLREEYYKKMDQARVAGNPMSAI